MEYYRRFSLLPFPQYFDGTTLTLNIVVLPRNQNPLRPAIELNDPPVPDAAPFADAQLAFSAKIISGLASFPHTLLPNATRPLTTTSPTNARALFEALGAAFQIDTPNATNVDLSLNKDRATAATIQERSVKKYLPHSYRKAFNFTTTRTRNAYTDDSYHCAIRNAAKVPGFQRSLDTVSWGKVFAYALRQPLLAQQLGMVYTTQLQLDAADFPAGGWLYIDLGDGSDYLAQQQAVEQYNIDNAATETFIKRYAARIPALQAGESRQVFAPLLFPVLFKANPADPDPIPDGNHDQLLIEAAEYDDGFAKIVHAQQPPSRNLLAEEHDGAHPVKDVGVRLGWDDEQLLIWYMRQLMIDPTVANPDKRIDAPLGVFGYAIDVRDVTAGAGAWSSLNEVQSKAPLALSPDLPLGAFTGELAYQVYPAQIDGDTAEAYWLPMYFANWNGQSMVLPDLRAAEIYQTTDPTVKGDPETLIPVAKQDPSDPEYPNKKTGTSASGAAKNDLNKVYDAAAITAALQYGRSYEFRVRLRDLSGGGVPLLPAIEPINDTASNIAKCHFKRYVAPNQPRFVDSLPFNTDLPGNPQQLDIRRPLLGYPAVVYTGRYADPITLLKNASIAMQGTEAFGVPDPDVDRVEITVEVRTLQMDNLASSSGKENYIELYKTERSFPQVLNEADYDAALTIPIVYRDCHVLHSGDELDLVNDLGLADTIDNLAEIVIPTARTVRLTLRALCEEKPVNSDYYGSLDADLEHDVRYGQIIQVQLYQPSIDETGLFVNASAAQQLCGIYLQPDPPYVFDGNFVPLLIRREVSAQPNLIQRLAQQLDLQSLGLTLTPRKGERVQFGCSHRIRHTLSPEHASLTIATKGDLLNHWICVLNLELNRDWMWDVLQDTSFVITRTIHFGHDDVTEIETAEVGTIEMRHTASFESLHNPKRNSTRIIFVDAVEPKNPRTQAPEHPEQLRFPATIQVSYTVEPRFKSDQPVPPEVVPPFEISLPITTPPTQMPRIASAGIALSPYRRNEKYSASEPRRRYLWIEFAEPIHDPQDTYFARVLAYAPDQLISNNEPELLAAPEEPALPIDPELIRVVAPSASNDLAGLQAMQPMQKASDSDRHYLLPLPPGIHADAAEMFGFFTYEFRVGHYRDGATMAWTTAQGRFGRPLRATGIQHPAPTLTCAVNRDEDKVYVSAPYAVAEFNGRNVTADPPRTQLWCLLYAQVRQADNKDYRNILLDDRQLDWRIQIETEQDVDWLTRYSDVERRTLKGITVKSLRDDVAYAKYNHLYKLADVATVNTDSTKYGTVAWTNDEIRQVLALYGLPIDSPLSVLVVEMLPTITNIFDHVSRLGQAQTLDTLRDTMRVAHNLDSGQVRERVLQQERARTFEEGPSPLSDELGQHRILRTSPLTEVPYVC